MIVNDMNRLDSKNYIKSVKRVLIPIKIEKHLTKNEFINQKIIQLKTENPNITEKVALHRAKVIWKNRR